MNRLRLASIKKDFPIFRKGRGKELVYLDSTATSLKPRPVIKAIANYYQEYSANVFRGLYQIAEKATAEYEAARQKLASFVNATKDEVVFVRGATEAINLVSYAWGRLNVGKGDEVITTIMEHHSNFVPWQQLAQEKGAKIKYLDIDEQGYLDPPAGGLRKIISKKTKLLAITHVSNVLGTINPIREIVREVKKINPNCLVLVDGAQAVPHLPVDVQNLGCDFYVFSGHKMLGPTGIGVLWARQKLLEGMAPFNFGGEMIERVTLEKTTFKEPPHKFEAGTPHIAGVIGLGAAANYLKEIGMENVRVHEKELVDYGLKKIGQIPGLTIYGPTDSANRGGVIAFNLAGIHPHDVAQILDEEGICIRVGHHCAMPLHQRLGIPASARASFYIYNNKDDVDKLVKGLLRVKRVFRS